MNYRRNFEHEGRPYHVDIGVRGYLFELDPPPPGAPATTTPAPRPAVTAPPAPAATP